jgi:hypothetical protein
VSNTTPKATVTIRRPLRAGTGAVLFGVLDLFLAGAVVVAHGLLGKLFWGALLILAVVTTIRMARSAVVVTPDGLTLRDTLRTHRLSWSQVQYISPASDDPAFRAIGVVTRDGRQLRCAALMALRFERSSDPRLQKLYERLNGHLQLARAEGRCPPVD